ncbi:MAG: hypothetical protein DI634_09180 [Kocuria palustris]|nr:MAG: hypothetical protein DI634_09180 [Kocuria palustris]
MDPTLNDAQLLVLRWVADGTDLDNPPSETFKTSTVALRSRGVVTLDKRRGHWSISITEAGRFYLEHGRRPDAEEPKPKKPPKPKPEPKKPRSATAESDDGTDNEPSSDPAPPARPERVVKDETIPMPVQIRRPPPGCARDR